MVAREGWPYLIFVGIVCILVYREWGVLWASPIAVLGIGLYFLFRDPVRVVPPEPLGAIAPVDGEVLEVGPYQDGALSGCWMRITIDTDHLGAYTVRAPIEGAIRDVAEHDTADDSAPLNGMWLRSEEAHDVILMFPGRFRALGPKAFVRYGERVGQGQRFAYLRFAPRAEIFLPMSSQARVAAGERVIAGETILADLPG